MLYYLALSVFSSSLTGYKKHSGIEARRILSILNEKPFNENDIAKEAAGRPYFRDGEADFSIAHSGNAAAVSFVKGGDFRTGCDIERIRPRSQAANIAGDYFSIAENKYIFKSGILDEKRFYEIWTLKECFIKLRGLSVFDMACVPSFIGSDACGSDKFVFCAPVSLPLSFGLYELTDNSNNNCYMLAAVIEGTHKLPQIRLFSQFSLDCKIIAEINAAPNPAQTVSPKR